VPSLCDSAVCRSGGYLLEGVYPHSSRNMNFLCDSRRPDGPRREYYVARGVSMGLDMNINYCHYVYYVARGVSMNLEMNIKTFYCVYYVARGVSMDLDISNMELYTAIEANRAK
jgi:hypothetical protein